MPFAADAAGSVIVTFPAVASARISPASSGASVVLLLTTPLFAAASRLIARNNWVSADPSAASAGVMPTASIAPTMDSCTPASHAATTFVPSGTPCAGSLSRKVRLPPIV